MIGPSRLARIGGHIALMRPYAWLWFDVLPACVLISFLQREPIAAPRIVAFLSGIVLADSGVSTLNDLCDRETDRRSTESNRNTRPLVTGLVSPGAALVQAVVLLVAAPLVMALASIPSALVFVAAILLGVAYSAPPFRLSGRPFSQLVWPVLGVICYAVVALFTGRWVTPATLLYLAGVGFLYAVAETLAKDIRDWENDSATGKRTTVVVLGTARAGVASLLASCVGSAFLVFLLWWRGGMHLASRAAGTAVLALWLVLATTWIAKLRRTYEKDTARRLHVGFIRVYLFINAMLLADPWLPR